jgi:hypothetical protein
MQPHLRRWRSRTSQARRYGQPNLPLAQTLGQQTCTHLRRPFGREAELAIDRRSTVFVHCDPQKCEQYEQPRVSDLIWGSAAVITISVGTIPH